MLTTSLGLRIGSLGNSTYSNKLCSDELGFDLWLSIFQEHGQNLAEVRVQLIERFRLRVCTGETRNEAYEEAGLRRPFDDCGVRLHARETNTTGRAILHTPVSPTNLSLSRARPPRASVSDSRKLAKHEGLQARASVRPRVGCSAQSWAANARTRA